MDKDGYGIWLGTLGDVAAEEQTSYSIPSPDSLPLTHNELHEY